VFDKWDEDAVENVLGVALDVCLCPVFSHGAHTKSTERHCSEEKTRVVKVLGRGDVVRDTRYLFRRPKLHAYSTIPIIDAKLPLRGKSDIADRLLIGRLELDPDGMRFATPCLGHECY
jgi:hypothetical protein